MEDGRKKKSPASIMQRVRVQPFLVFEKSAQAQGDLPVLAAFQPRWERPGIKQDVAPKHFEILDPVERLRLWNAIGRWHDIPPWSGGSVTELSVTDGGVIIKTIMPQRMVDLLVNIARSQKFNEPSSECRPKRTDRRERGTY